MSNDPAAPPVRPCLVLEYLPGGELFDKIVEKSYFTEADAANIFRKLMETIKDLHSIGVVHRDLKPENIIYGDSEDVIKICDFGTAKLMDESKDDIFAEFKVGSPGYFAPETIYKNYQCANDIWSMGCILYTLLAGYMAFDMDDPMLILKLMTCKYEFHDESWKNISSEAKDLISKMLTKSTKERITAEEVLKHKWFIRMKKRPSQANLGETLVRLKELNDEKEKKKQLMREYFFNNVLSVRARMTDMISNSKRAGMTAMRSIRTRGMSTFSQRDMSQRSRSNSKRGIVLKHTKPKNRQEMLSDIRAHRGMVEMDDEEEEPEVSSRDRSKSTFDTIRTALKGVSRRKKKKVKGPKNIQAMLSDIRTRKSVRLLENHLDDGVDTEETNEMKSKKIESML